MVSYIEWPRELISPRHYTPGFDPQTNPQDRMSLTGRLGNGSVPGLGIWRPRFSEVPVHQRINQSAFDALAAQMNGRDVHVLLPFYHFGKYPKGSDPVDVGFANGMDFDGGNRFVSTGTTALVAENAFAGSAAVQISKVACATIIPGHAFSIGRHLYQIRFVDMQNDNTAQVRIRPELRDDILIRDEVEFARPWVMATLVEGMGMDFDQQFGRYGTPSLQFIENTAPFDPDHEV
ncbi:hypothetical protein [Pseudovibrio sp. SPO723]|uniref:hypothetical protein n=1 Tax=Nesiotobacter zosterae TaxID=392721 RepID=UPI0029C2D4DE|nr:hypothetical protein [Pseudovibrio sp. SPO723]MDX5595658.1 hypothetical protein [Pseudovibrio sp. SPO723]